jgi:CDP-glucose 4,6-dehydratase
MLAKEFWKDKKVFITGHTGFKGSWLSLWLNLLGAEVTGYALTPPTNPSLFNLCKIDKLVKSIIADVRDKELLTKTISAHKPEIVMHMAAQPLVQQAYKIPAETYDTNVMGTVNLFEAIRKCASVRAVINVTTDKCYENKETLKGYRESDPLGGYDPYSSSKACSELITSSYRNSFFNPKDFSIHHVSMASARAGNVIGGGDWACDRLIPDCIRALLKKETIIIRHPKAIRPWQHVLEPLSGYLILAQKLYVAGPRYAEAWNFGPSDKDSKTVEWIVKRICTQWGQPTSYALAQKKLSHETTYLKLDCSKAKLKLGWHPKWNLEYAIDKIIEWTKAYREKKEIRQMCLKQIAEDSG